MTIKKFKHKAYIVDSRFKRARLGGPVENYVYTVDQLTELEAKDLCCDLMDCIVKLENCADKMGNILEDHNFR